VIEQTRVMIADDDESVGAALLELIRSQSDLAVAGFAFDTRSAIELAAQEQPDIAIVDVNMPGGGGVEATLGIKQASPATRVIAFSAEDDNASRSAMTQAGANDYLVKGASIDVILATLRLRAADDTA
jgi:DNA-binding NarL/FixJ family response regulator